MTGRLAISKAGHDKGELYVITGQEGDFVYLCDGRLKTPEKPKKKRLKHIQLMRATVDEALLGKLQNGERVYAAEIKYALKQYSAGYNGSAEGRAAAEE